MLLVSNGMEVDMFARLGVAVVLLLLCSATYAAGQDGVSGDAFLTVHIEAEPTDTHTRSIIEPETGEALAVRADVALDLAHFVCAHVGYNQTTEQHWTFVILTEMGQARLTQLTAENLNRRIVFVLDEEAVQTATIRSEIRSARVPVAPRISREAATELAQRINDALSWEGECSLDG
jgi:preprotein translocase subunit SecD